MLVRGSGKEKVADAGVGEREGEGCRAQLGQPLLLRLFTERSGKFPPKTFK